MRERIFAVASLWIGRPFSSTSIVTSTVLEPSLRSTFTTLPTFTPAMRTGESRRRSLEVWKTAWNSNGSRQGSDFVNASQVAIVMISSAIAPARTGLMRPRSLRGTTLLSAGCHYGAVSLPCSSVSVPWLPGRLPISCLLRT